MTAPAQPACRGRWIDHWEPEDLGFWETTGKRVANRNLCFSVLAEHIGFSMWTIWSVMVLFMGPAYHIDSAGKFFLVSLPSLIGGLIRLPYTMAPARFGGGNFVSSMVNINAFFPEGRKGWALGLNAGGGNLGVAAVQLLGLAVIATVGAAYPRLVLASYIPLILLTAFFATRYMNNISSLGNDTGALRSAVREAQTWVVFIGPLIGSLIRSVGGRLADRFGGVKVTFGNFFGMALATSVVIVAANQKSLPLFMAGFVALFVLSGVGNGSTYKMIPSIFNVRARAAIAAGEPRQSALMTARRLSGAVIGIAGAIGAMGGLLINLAFRESFRTTKSGVPAFWSFLIFYAACILITYVVYLRREPVAVRSETVRLAHAQV
ncbi:MAG: MFS transporter [Pseudonocardiaceae bacterium]